MTKSASLLIAALALSASGLSTLAVAQTTYQDNSMSISHEQSNDRRQLSASQTVQGGAHSAHSQQNPSSSPHIEILPLSFFQGGISYGVGFPTHIAYGYSGGFAYTISQTRFSGVQQRSPTPLIPPVRHQRHAPPNHPGSCRC